jgi:hypothetical protein
LEQPFSRQAQATGNFAPQYHDLHHPEYPQFNHQSSHPSSYNYSAQKLSLEDTLKASIQELSQNIQELKSVKANFSNPGFDSNSNFYKPDCSNHFDFSRQAQATGNYAPQYHDQHHPEYQQFNNQSSHPSSYNYPVQELSLEDTLKAFIQTSSQIIQELNQSTQELKNATMSNSQTIQDWVQDDSTSTGGEHYPTAHIDDLDGRVNQLMVARYYTSMINEDGLAILVICMSLPPPYLRVRKLWMLMRRKKKRSKLSTKRTKLSTQSQLSP